MCEEGKDSPHSAAIDVDKTSNVIGTAVDFDVILTVLRSFSWIYWYPYLIRKVRNNLLYNQISQLLHNSFEQKMCARKQPPIWSSG